MENKYLLIHTHRHGTSTLFFESDNDLQTIQKNELQVITQLGIDYEPERNEEIEIIELPRELQQVQII